MYLGETRTLFIAVFPLGWLNTICHCIASCLLRLGWLSKPGTFIIPSVLDAAAPWWSYWPSSSYMALGPVCQYLFCAGEPRSGCGAPGVVSQMPNKRLNLFWYTPPGLAQYQVNFSRRKLSLVIHIQLALQDTKIFPFVFLFFLFSFFPLQNCQLQLASNCCKHLSSPRGRTLYLS